MFSHRKFIVLAIIVVLGLPIYTFAQEANISLLSSDPIYELSAGLGAGIEYTDNVDNVRVNPQSAFLTHARPAFSFSRQGGRIEADISYNGDYSFDLNNDFDPQYLHTFVASVNANIVEDFFSISINESMQQVYESVTLSAFESADDVGDSRNQNVITIAPNITLAPSPRTNISIGYSFTDTRYSLDQIARNPSFLSLDSDQYTFKYNVNHAHNGTFRINHEFTDRMSSYMGGGYTRQVYEEENSNNLTRYNLYLGVNFQISERLSANIEAGPNYSVPDIGEPIWSPYGQASINYTLGRSVFSFSYNTSFEDDINAGTTINKSSYSLAWNKAFERSSLNLTFVYNTFETSVAYRPGVTPTEQSNTFDSSLSFNYEISPRSSFFINYSAVIYEEHNLGDNKHIGSYGLSYAMSEHSSFNLSHKIQYTLPQLVDSYYQNQIMFNFTYKL